MLKKLFIIVTCFTLLLSCGKTDDYSALNDYLNKIDKRVTALENLCEKMNTNISSLQTIVNVLQKADYITSLSPITEGDVIIGYTINFLNNKSIDIYYGKDGVDGKDGQNGADGYTPIIGVKQDIDGQYYWTIDGEWLLDNNGNKIRVTGDNGKDGADGKDGENGKDGQNGQDGRDGITPKLKIENSTWFVSYDNGETWNELGSDVNPEESTSPDSIFESLIQKDNLVYFTLKDGNTITVPMYKPLELMLDIKDNEMGADSSQTLFVNYSLSGNISNETIVTASSDGKYIVEVISTDSKTGTIRITCPNEYSDGFINIMVYDGKGYAIVKVINFYKRMIQLPNGLEYFVSSEGGELSIPLTTNIDYTINIDNSWISLIPDTKASVRTDILKLKVQENKTATIRTATISIIPKNGGEKVHSTITIKQTGSKAILTASEAKKLAEALNEGEKIDSVFVKGIVSSIISIDTSIYGDASYYISDDGSKNNEFYIYHGYGLGGAKFKTSDDIKLGDEVIILGPIINYKGNTPEMTSGSKIINLNGVIDEGTQPDNNQPELTKLTIAEFLTKTVNTTDWYELTGTITSIVNTKYGNFYIDDGTAEVYVYGLTSKWIGTRNDQSFSSLNLKVGDIVTLGTLRGEYLNEPQATGPIQAFYISHIAGSSDVTEIQTSTPTNWLELPATDREDLYFIHHPMTIDGKRTRNFSYYYDADAKLALWVAYPLNKSLLQGNSGRTDDWSYDPKVPKQYQQCLYNGYKGGYDRGHQIPSADRQISEANRKTFYFTNMTPQRGELNQRQWANLEGRVRSWANSCDTLYVVTGANLDNINSFAEDNNGELIPVPSGYFKALLAKIGAKYHGIAFYYEHKEYTNDIMNQSMTIDALEDKLGIDFFVNLPSLVGQSLADETESKIDNWWGN